MNVLVWRAVAGEVVADDDNPPEQRMYKNLKTCTLVSSIFNDGRMTHVRQAVFIDDDCDESRFHALCSRFRDG